MNIIKYLDSSDRIIIPKSFRQSLKLHKNQKMILTLDLKDNKIILTPISNQSEVNVSDQNKSFIITNLNQSFTPDKIKHIISSLKLNINPINKFKLTDVIEFISPQKDKSIIKFDFCSKCKRIVEPESFIKVNGHKLCLSCIHDLKKQLIQNIY